MRPSETGTEESFGRAGLERSRRCPTSGFRSARRILGDKILCSTAALILSRIPRQIRGQFFDEKAKGGRQFKSALLHISVSRGSVIAENRSKSARVRAICDRART